MTNAYKRFVEKESELISKNQENEKSQYVTHNDVSYEFFKKYVYSIEDKINE